MSDRYTYRVTWSEEDEEYVGLCLEFPLLSWLAERPEDAFAGIRRTVADAVEDMQSAGEAVPEPLATRPYSGRILLRVPPETHRELATQAAEEGVSLNRLLNARLSYAPLGPAPRPPRA